MDFGNLVFLNANFYEKNGEPRCYAQFARLETGEVMSFASHSWSRADRPHPFAICSVKGDMRQYGKAVSFVLVSCDVIGQLQ